MGHAAFTRITDDAKRISDEMNMHAVVKDSGWAAFRLSDGSPVDHNAYPSRRAAVLAMRWNANDCMYLEIAPDGMRTDVAQTAIDFQRMLRDSLGLQFADPDFDFDSSRPILASDRHKTLRHLASGGREY